MVRSVAIWYNVLICKENVESSMTKWCILTLFETYARRLLGGICLGPQHVLDIIGR